MDDDQVRPARGGWWTALCWTPLAAAVVFGAFWLNAFYGGSGYPTGAVILAFCITSAFGIADSVKYRHRAAWLMNLPLIGVFVCSGFAVYDIAMDYRGIVDQCVVLDVTDREVSGRFGSHMESELAVDCYGFATEVTVGFGEFEDPNGYGLSDDHGLETDPLDGCCFSDSVPEQAIEVEYDPREILDSRASHIERDPADFGVYVFVFLGLALFVRIAFAIKPP
ncbi:hypothetical protein [Glycomyces buryatensis]|uniref:Uncharacterized protein n=1 Tax=Glycomyces buryatensis TaxID=2570927 RepID=A0A4S8QDF1_9ACTN|nr:hypothetical protein [Glycomyces buryatensis]THV42398.1 hypothetical protein FAB82_07025 [Glycomyces buryatensis]